MTHTFLSLTDLLDYEEGWQELDSIVHSLLGLSGDPPPYSTSYDAIIELETESDFQNPTIAPEWIKWTGNVIREVEGRAPTKLDYLLIAPELRCISYILTKQWLLSRL